MTATPLTTAPLAPLGTSPLVRVAPALRRVSFTFAADGGFAACLASSGEGGWFVESWRLTSGGAIPMPLPQGPGQAPEDVHSPLVSLPDGRVLVCRRQGERHEFVVRTPASVREVSVGVLRAPVLRLLAMPAPGPGGPVAVALGSDARQVTTVWLVSSDGRAQPQQVAEFAGLTGGGVWLDQGGRLLALDRVVPPVGGPGPLVKTVLLDLALGQVSPLLELAPQSNDRLVAADPRSGLILVRSDAPGEDRLGWGVLGGGEPLRFPDCLHRAAPRQFLRPIAIEPGPADRPAAEQRVALQGDWGAGSSLAVWRPAEGRLVPVPVPPGRLGGVGHWSAGEDGYGAAGSGGLRIPYSSPDHPAGVATVDVDLLRRRPVEPDEPAPTMPLRLAPLQGGSAGMSSVMRILPKVPQPGATGAIGTGGGGTSGGGTAGGGTGPGWRGLGVGGTGAGGNGGMGAGGTGVGGTGSGAGGVGEGAGGGVGVGRAGASGWRLDGSAAPTDGGRWHSARTVELAGAAGPLEAVVYGGDTWLTAQHLAVALHGGPADAWRLEFDPALQRMAAEGLSVVAVNQRGSTGYGREHAQALQNAWGGPDLDDVMTLLASVSGQRVALGLEPASLFGVSYGAFLALLAACSVPDLVTRCAVVAPFLSGARLQAEAGPAVQALTRRLGGTLEPGDGRGPRDVLALCHRLTAPLLVVHGDGDQVVPVGQSRTLRQELLRSGRTEGVDFRYVEAAGAGHEVLAEDGAPVLHELLARFLRTGSPT
ncbi:alpha/beta fold hydrolase [Streptacidiphilus sp. EB129]|uniref:S9 family peptidase n=1 Tax=Streptacidiphilus sp. EB129 TaxID=3156262 RepID=UPI003518B4E2